MEYLVPRVLVLSGGGWVTALVLVWILGFHLFIVSGYIEVAELRLGQPWPDAQ